MPLIRLLFVLSVLLSSAFSQTPQIFGFEQNAGQFPPKVLFVHRSSSNLFYVTRDAMVLSNGVRLQLSDVDPNAVAIGDSPSATIYNFYQGRNPSNWRTGFRMFGAVRVNNIYPGVSAVFTTSSLNFPGTPTSLGQGEIILTVQPGADLDRFHLHVLNSGATPFEGPGGIWFTGGRVPGVFIVSARTTQAGVPIVSNLKMESSEILSIQAPGRNPALPTEVAITFPDYDDSGGASPQAAKATDGNRYLASQIRTPTDFGEDGQLDLNNCNGSCTDVIIARLDDSGKPVWVTLFGGEGDDSPNLETASSNGVVVSGTTTSQGFPVTSNAPQPALRSSRDVFLTLFDRDSGQLRNSTYAGLEGPRRYRPLPSIRAAMRLSAAAMRTPRPPTLVTCCAGGPLTIDLFFRCASTP
jgi:hypothetical protein